jgi:hypothetical protein
VPSFLIASNVLLEGNLPYNNTPIIIAQKAQNVKSGKRNERCLKNEAAEKIEEICKKSKKPLDKLRRGGGILFTEILYINM